MKRSLTDKLAFVTAPSLVKLGSVQNTIPDLQRILALPRRPPFVCERDANGNYPPATQALIEVETEKFSRGRRVSCGCRPRKIMLGADDMLTIFRELPPGRPPEPPIRATKTEFIRDCDQRIDQELIRKVYDLRPGGSLDVPPVDGNGHDCITELSPAQAWFLREAAQEGGAVGFMGVGSGKSIALLLAPLVFPDGRLAVLLIEPKQRQHYKSEYLRLREHFKVTSIAGEIDVTASTVPGTTPLHLISYSILSRTENSDKLDIMKPDILLLDEGHRACGTSAINRRVKRYITSRIKAREEAMARGERVRDRAVRLLVPSGTLEVKSINDTQMLCAYALGTGSPIPLDPNEAEAWSGVIDVSYKPDRKSATSRALHRCFGKGYVETDEIAIESLLFEPPEKDLREGFQKWRSETPGIITAAASDINASLYLGEFPLPKMPKIVQEALTRVRVDWARPDGAEFLEKIEQLACAKNVACGFYPYWAFPKHPCTCPPDRTKTRSENWCDQCCLIDDWYDRRKFFYKAERGLLLRAEVRLDSPALCEDAARRAWELPDTGMETFCVSCFANHQEVHWPCPIPGHLPGWRERTWPAWAAIANKVQYEERVKWIGHDTPEAEDPNTHPGYWLAREIAKWGKKHKGVIWFQSVPLGRKIAELGGLPYFNGGPGGEGRLRAEKGDRSIVCSISAHGAGTNGLQEIFDQQVLAEVPPSNATTHGLEQIFGRLHRRGQKSDEVNTLAAIPSYEFKDALRKAIEQAEFNYSMTKVRQKLLCCDLDIEDL